jgi:hypothetical protein
VWYSLRAMKWANIREIVDHLVRWRVPFSFCPFCVFVDTTAATRLHAEFGFNILLQPFAEQNVASYGTTYALYELDDFRAAMTAPRGKISCAEYAASYEKLFIDSETGGPAPLPPDYPRALKDFVISNGLFMWTMTNRQAMLPSFPLSTRPLSLDAHAADIRAVRHTAAMAYNAAIASLAISMAAGDKPTQ